MQIGYKNLFFLIPCLAVISLNFAFQPPFLAPQSHKHLETTKKRACWASVSQTIPFSPQVPHCPSSTEAKLLPDHRARGAWTQPENWRQESGVQASTPEVSTQCHIPLPGEELKPHCTAGRGVLKYQDTGIHWERLGAAGHPGRH